MLLIWLNMAVPIPRFNLSTRFEKIVDCIFPASGNRQNTGSGAFHGEEATKRIIRPFIRLIYDKLNPFKNPNKA